MSSSAVLPASVAELIEHKDFAAVEDVWTGQMERTPEDLPFFFAVAAAVKKKGGGEAAVSWLRFLADYQEERGDADRRLTVLSEIARMSPTDAQIRGELEAAIRARFAAHPMLPALLSHFPIASAADPVETAGRVNRWLRFSPGDVYLLPGRGAGRIAELNPSLDVIRVEVSGSRVPLSLVNAEKNLVPLPPGHFLREKVEHPEKVRALAEREPSETVRRLLESFGRPMPLVEVKENLEGVVEEARWGSFWTAARRHPQLLVSGTGKGATVAWSESAGAAEDSIHLEFEHGTPAQKIEIARKHSKRSSELARYFGDTLAAEARRAADQGDAALAWELSQAAVKIFPGEPEPFPADRLLATGRDLPAEIGRIHDHTAREKALEAARAGRADWAELFSQRVLEEEDARILAMLFRHLEELPERADDLKRRILRSPRQAPRAFLWLAEQMRAEGLPAPSSLFFSLLEALRQEEFSSHRARVKELFEPGNLAVALVKAAASEEEARDYLSALDRAGGLEEHRRSIVKEALLMRFPELRAPAVEYLYATAEAIEARRKELAHLKQVELPANAEAMRAAKDHGDLSENFEYHAARQRHEYLSARIAKLADELSRSRPLDPGKIDASEVRVGTRVVLRDSAGAERSATILGPWDSRPEDAVYSYESEFAQALLGKAPGDRVALSEGEAEIVSIAPWKELGAP